MRRASLADSIAQFRRLGRQTALLHHRGYRTERWSYAGLAEAAGQFAGELQDRGIEKGQRVLLWGEDSAEWIVAFLGCILRGAVVVPMDRGAAPDFAARVAAAVDPRLILAGRRQPAAGLPAAAGIAAPQLVLEDLISTIASRPPAPPRAAALGREDPLEIVFTSGTTAEPRGVVISHGNFLANLEPLETEIGKYLGYERLVHPLRFLALLPLSHVFGQFMGIFVPPLVRGTIVLLDTLNPAEVQGAIRRDRVSVLVTVPRLIEGLRDKVERDLEAEGRLERFRRDFAAAENLHFLRRWWRFRRIRRRFGWKFLAFISGGAALPENTEQFWFRLGYAVIQGYGLTETASLVSVQHPFRLARGSIGKVLPGSEIKLSETGEILVRGANVALGYWAGRGPSSLQPVAGAEGWFHTGDVGTLDAAGNLFFKGRRKNVIVTAAGLNVYPEDLEAALRSQPEVRDAVVIGLHRDGNAEPCAVLLLRQPAPAAAEAALRSANERLADYQRIRRWYVWPEDDFPRTPTRKPQLQTIEAAVRAALGAAGAAGAAPAAGGLADLVARVTGRPVEPLTPGASLSRDLRLSSIERVELLAALEDRYQVELNETRFTEAATLGELEQMLRQPAARRSDYVYPRWAQRWPVTWIRVLVYYLLSWPATLLLGYPAIRGREQLAGVRGPALVVCNHISTIDVGFVLAALPARFRRLAVAMEGERLARMRNGTPGRSWIPRHFWRVIYALVVAFFNVFPLPQHSGFRESFAYAGQSVDRGYSLLVFPEGGRTPDGRIQPFRAGIGLLALGLNLPVVPVRIDGLFELKQARRWFTRPGRVRVTLGAPVRFQPGADPEEIALELQRRVASL